MASHKEIRQLFFAEGWSVAGWAREHGFPPNLVYRVLRGETQCLRGTTHAIGIALGIKSPSSEELRKILPSGPPAALEDTPQQKPITGVINTRHSQSDVQTSSRQGG
jgi:gp16 family phage-associated protein